MQMRPEIQIASMIKAMKDVVIPALAGSNKLATEQASLVVGMLHLMASQLPHQFRFDRDELTRLIECTKSLQAIDTKDAATAAALAAMTEQRSAADSVLGECQRDPAELKESVRNLRTCVGDLVTALARTKELDNQLQAEKIVIDMSREQLLRDRSLLKLQGWEPDPAAVPDIAKLLA